MSPGPSPDHVGGASLRYVGSIVDRLDAALRDPAVPAAAKETITGVNQDIEKIRAASQGPHGVCDSATGRRTAEAFHEIGTILKTEADRTGNPAVTKAMEVQQEAEIQVSSAYGRYTEGRPDPPERPGPKAEPDPSAGAGQVRYAQIHEGVDAGVSALMNPELEHPQKWSAETNAHFHEVCKASANFSFDSKSTNPVVDAATLSRLEEGFDTLAISAGAMAGVCEARHLAVECLEEVANVLDKAHGRSAGTLDDLESPNVVRTAVETKVADEAARVNVEEIAEIALNGALADQGTPGSRRLDDVAKAARSCVQEIDRRDVHEMQSIQRGCATARDAVSEAVRSTLSRGAERGSPSPGAGERSAPSGRESAHTPIPTPKRGGSVAGGGPGARSLNQDRAGATR